MRGEKDVLYRAGRESQRADDCRPLTLAVREGTMTLHALARGHYPGERLLAAEAPGVCSVGFWHATGEQRHGLAPHCNEGIELTLSLQGESPVMVDGQNHTLRPGTVMITRPWQLHSVGNPRFASGKIGWLILDVGVRHPHQAWHWPEWINLSAGDLRLLTQSLRQNEDAIRAATPALRDAFARLVTLPTTGSELFRGSRIAVATCDVLVRLLELFHSHPVRLRPALTDSSRSIRLYLRELADRPIPQSVGAFEIVKQEGPALFGRHAHAVKTYFLTLPIIGPHAHQVALVGDDVDQLILAKEASHRRVGFALLLAGLDGKTDVVSPEEAEAHHRVRDKR